MREGTKQFVVRLPEDQYEQVKQAAAIEGVSMGAFVRSALEGKLTRHRELLRRRARD